MRTGFTLRKSIFFALILICTISVVLTGCNGNKPIKIGLSVELTGSRAMIGVAARNGATLAVDQINKQGGINGRPIELLIRDDKGAPVTAQAVDAELVDEGVAAIIGHVISQQTLAVFEQMNQAETVLISPTSSSPDFTGQDDYFFRVMQTNETFGTLLGQYIYQQGYRTLAGTYDISNLSFAKTLWDIAKDEFIAQGGEVITEVGFISTEQPDLHTVAADLTASDPEAVLIVASDIDTALIVQFLKIQGSDAQLFGSSWAVTNELLQKGGGAIEGMVLTALTNDQDMSDSYLDFQSAYIERFGIEPGLGASHAYEAVLVLAEALQQTNGSKEGLREALLAISDFQGINGKITFDEFGDVYRESYLVQVQDHQFITIASIRLDD